MAGSLIGLACTTLPLAWVRHRIAVQHSALCRALPDFLDLMIVCLESGLSVQGTIARVGDEISIASAIGQRVANGPTGHRIRSDG